MDTGLPRPIALRVECDLAGATRQWVLPWSRSWGLSADSSRVAVAIGAPCIFLTPIGHQDSALILGPGGLRFYAV